MNYDLLEDIYNKFFLNPSFSMKIFIKQKSPSAKGQRAGNVWLPLLERFGTFCWGEIIEELQNTYKLKELINLPVSVPNNV